MVNTNSSIPLLISLPEAVVSHSDNISSEGTSKVFMSSDPSGLPLGSGGGTAHLLARAWRSSGSGMTFQEWLHDPRKLIIHGGGQSRRLPSYAGVGKPLIPIPVIRHSYGEYLDQSWLDVQTPYYERVISAAPDGTVAMVTSGDVLLRFADQLPNLPSADIITLGMAVEPEQAKNFGVFFTSGDTPNQIEFFLQKPSIETINSLSLDYRFLIDTGMWLLSERAVMLLMKLCGWDEPNGCFPNGNPSPYELYSTLGLSLGCNPGVRNADISNLSCAVVQLPSPEFYHLGTSRQIIETFTVLQNRNRNGSIQWVRHPDQFIQNSMVDAIIQRETNHTLWIENSVIPKAWKLECEHVLTGVPENDWALSLDRSVCLDFVPIGLDEFCIRAYGIDDSFSGSVGDTRTQWFGRSAISWFAERGVSLESAGIDPDTDIQRVKLFPVLKLKDIDAPFIRWLYSAKQDDNENWSGRWIECRRLSANDIRSQLNVKRLLEQRQRYQAKALKRIYGRGDSSIFHHLDLEKTAGQWVNFGLDVPKTNVVERNPLAEVHDHMFRAAVICKNGGADWHQEEASAFAILRETLLTGAQLAPANPRCCVLADQIIWGRSPARLDLAGGWSDTPPYCLEHGGKVVNVAVNLNGQPPIQVFGKLCSKPEIVVRSIDLGVETTFRSYKDLESYAEPGSEFALAKAALAVVGFLPRFHQTGGFSSLEDQLKDFGGGIELSLLAAIPQGSGLGTSSILAATLLGTLSELCGLNWDKHDLISRTMAVEQMLTTGGGWQDQVGAIFGGIKLIETTSGLVQRPVIRWLPDHLFSEDKVNKRILLYYTGLTRLAKNILQEIVRGMFLNSSRCLDVVGQIERHANAMFDAIQRNDYEQLCAAIHRSWLLNQQLDSGTNPLQVQEILNTISDDLAAAKLLGAGGGGYLLMFAKDQAAGERIRGTLSNNPPNSRARFIDMAVSHSGLEITRS